MLVLCVCKWIELSGIHANHYYYLFLKKDHQNDTNRVGAMNGLLLFYIKKKNLCHLAFSV